MPTIERSPARDNVTDGNGGKEGAFSLLANIIVGMLARAELDLQDPADTPT
jgi:hypothetical protein